MAEESTSQKREKIIFLISLYCQVNNLESKFILSGFEQLDPESLELPFSTL